MEVLYHHYTIIQHFGPAARVKEFVAISPLQKQLLGNPPCYNPQVCSRITSREVIAASNLQVGLLNERWPE